MTAQYVVGIDLGTTNSVLAFAPLDRQEPETGLLAIPQLVAAHTVESRSVLPSFLYLAGEHDGSGGAYDLPWGACEGYVVGALARDQAAEMPHRVVGAAKSWLCHSRVDRRAAILPWNAPPEVPKVSPVEVSQRYLAHLAAAWDAAHPSAPLRDQQVVLTVPASFDASARELTRQAALAAGLPEDLILLEEPQAAVYAWLGAVGDRWRRQLVLGDRLLVCDVGGGTTDLTLIGVSEESGNLILERIAVGNHLLVGGDNMDLALAHMASQRLEQQGHSLDPWQSVGLWHACRAAKESLLSTSGPEKHTISVLGRGSRLVGGTISVEVERASAAELLLEGFFPRCSLDDRPQRRPASGFRQLGLPFETDTAITRHLAAFLTAHGEGRTEAVRPTHVLFNGGVFRAEPFRNRLMEVLAEWFPQADPPKLLWAECDLDHAVARGAAYYGWAKQRGGIRIRGGTARAYYVGVETAGPAIPGAPRPLRALCVVPFGMEEGTECDVPGEEIGLVVGHPAQFRFFSSPVRKHDRPGDVLDTWNADELVETDSLEAVLPADEDSADDYVPVRFHPRVTELGMLELWCVSTKDDRRWKLEFSVREQDAEP